MTSAPIPVMVVYGTRPEAVKLAPIILALQASDQFTCDVVVTGQHRDMLDQINAGFGIVPDVDLDIFRHGQSITMLAAKTLAGMEPVLRDRRPRAILVQGDTTSALAAGLAAFYAGVPVVHVEAGLRTPTLASPFPEEGNRRLLSRITALHLAATGVNRDTLVAERIDADSIVVTGNPVIDALQTAVRLGRVPSDERVRAAAESGRRLVLVTSHRRESWGKPMEDIAAALRTSALTHPDVDFIFPLHANPRVRNIFRPVLADRANVILAEPLEYFELAYLLARVTLVLTDSGGLQEEAPALNVPVIVLREETERIEGVRAGTAILVGTDPAKITSAVRDLLADESRRSAVAAVRNPYGDGRAAERTLAALAHHFGVGNRLLDFA